MEGLSEKLLEELNCATVFSFVLPNGFKVEVAESVVVTWIIMGVLILTAIILGSGLKVHNISKRQAVAELVVTKLENFVGDMVGKDGKAFVPYLSTVLLYLVLANIIGIFGFKPPTKDLSVTIALAVMSIVLVEAAGIYYLGIKKWLHKFLEPVPIVAPINVLEIVTRPLSLCMRLFGNVLGAFVIMELIHTVAPAVVPSIAGLYFDLFDGILQAYVFVFLTSIYIKEELE